MLVVEPTAAAAMPSTAGTTTPYSSLVQLRGPILEMEQVLLIAPLMLKCLNFLENGFGIKGATHAYTAVGCS